MTDLSQTVEKALAHWGLEDAKWSLVAARENHVFQVDHPAGRNALRLHRPGYRSDAELRSELTWLEAVGRGGLSVPRPVASASGTLLLDIDGFQVDLVSWLDGQPIGTTGIPLALADKQSTFRSIGHEMAHLHEVSDAWAYPNSFTRMAWDREGLLGEAPIWGRFWENPTLSAEERDMLVAFRRTADTKLQELEAVLDYGLIHADLVRENIMIDGDRVQMIDFDDGGFGFRLFDIATALSKNFAEPDYPKLKSALLEGYRSVRPLDTAVLELFLSLRAVTYVGWIVPRMSEEGAEARNARFVQNAVQLAEEWLSTPATA